MRSYLLVFDQTRLSRDTIIARIDGIDFIDDWYAMFGNTMILASESDTGEISRAIRARLPDLTFIVTEIDPATREGWLPAPVWAFIDEPRRTAAEPA